jgi:hypothetical protein
VASVASTLAVALATVSLGSPSASGMPLTPEQSEEITQIIRAENAATLKKVFASVARNDDDPPLFDLPVILQF